MKKVNWLVVGIVVIVLLLFLFGGGMMFGGWGYHGYGMMGRGYSPFGWFGMGLGMLFMWIIPLGVLVLIGFGVAALVRNSGNGIKPTISKPCPNCGKDIQADWQNCPYCGTTLK